MNELKPKKFNNFLNFLERINCPNSIIKEIHKFETIPIDWIIDIMNTHIYKKNPEIVDYNFIYQYISSIYPQLSQLTINDFYKFCYCYILREPYNFTYFYQNKTNKEGIEFFIKYSFEHLIYSLDLVQIYQFEISKIPKIKNFHDILKNIRFVIRNVGNYYEIITYNLQTVREKLRNYYHYRINFRNKYVNQPYTIPKFQCNLKHGQIIDPTKRIKQLKSFINLALSGFHINNPEVQTFVNIIKYLRLTKYMYPFSEYIPYYQLHSALIQRNIPYSLAMYISKFIQNVTYFLITNKFEKVCYIVQLYKPLKYIDIERYYEDSYGNKHLFVLFFEKELFSDFYRKFHNVSFQYNNSIILPEKLGPYYLLYKFEGRYSGYHLVQLI